jgi:hypothetical protein
MVWHDGLFYKLELLLPTEYRQILKSYLSERYFRVKQEDEYSGLKPIKAGVPQGSVLGPVLYLIYTSDIPQPEGTTVATFLKTQPSWPYEVTCKMLQITTCR